MKKDIKFSTRMASADREAIKELAKRSGMSMSDYHPLWPAESGGYAENK